MSAVRYKPCLPLHSHMLRMSGRDSYSVTADSGAKLPEHRRRAFSFGNTTDFDPFLLLDDFRNEVPEDYLAGFPWHPHRGIETITYVLAGKEHHRSTTVLATRFFSGLSIECCLGAQRHRRLIRPSPFSIPQIAGQGAGRASRGLPRYRLPGRFAGGLPAAREESQRLSAADVPDEDFWTSWRSVLRRHSFSSVGPTA